MGRFIKTLATLLMVVGMMLASIAGAASVAAQDEEMPTVTVGSKNFTESIVLAEMVALLLEDAGYTVERQTDLGGTTVVHQALLNDEVDVYVEYTGTGLLAILGMELPEGDATPAATPAAEASPVATAGTGQVYQIVKTEYAEQFNLEWLQPWGFQNTYALAVTQETADEYDLESVSDLEGVAGELTFGATQEFLVRDDGLPGLEEAYGLEFADEVGLDPGLTYQAVDQGEVDIISAFSTDGRIPALDLVVLEDDQSFFPPYYAAPVVRQDLLEAAPEVRDLLNQMAGRLDSDTMANLNFQVDEEGMEPVEVARGYLTEQGLIEGES